MMIGALEKRSRRGNGLEKSMGVGKGNVATVLPWDSWPWWLTLGACPPGAHSRAHVSSTRQTLHSMDCVCCDGWWCCSYWGKNIWTQCHMSLSHTCQVTGHRLWLVKVPGLPVSHQQLFPFDSEGSDKGWTLTKWQMIDFMPISKFAQFDNLGRPRSRVYKCSFYDCYGSTDFLEKERKPLSPIMDVIESFY